MSNKITDEEIERILKDKAEQIQYNKKYDYMFDTKRVFERVEQKKRRENCLAFSFFF